MYLYSNKNWKLEPTKEIWFKLEKDMQSLAEKNLREIFGLDFISSEFQLNNLRIDTLAFDGESNSFVIIEFKRWSSYSVIDQGFSYLSLLLNNKADFILLLQEKTKKTYKKDDIDWSQARVMFVADSFTRYQQESINFKDLPIELWEMKKFSNESIVFNSIKASNTAESIKTVTKFEWNFKEIEKENPIKTYIEDDHFIWKPDWIKELYEKFKSWLFEIDSNLQIVPGKIYIAFKAWKRNLIDVEIFNQHITLWINWKFWELDDKYWIIRNVATIWHHWNWDNEIKITSEDQFLKILDLIQQAHKKYNS